MEGGDGARARVGECDRVGNLSGCHGGEVHRALGVGQLGAVAAQKLRRIIVVDQEGRHAMVLQKEIGTGHIQ